MIENDSKGIYVRNSNSFSLISEIIHNDNQQSIIVTILHIYNPHITTLQIHQFKTQYERILLKTNHFSAYSYSFRLSQHPKR